MTKSNLIKLICLLIIIAVTVVASILLLGFLGSSGGGGTTLVISSGSSEAVYDGNPLTNPIWQVASGRLATGHVVTATVTGSQTEVGVSDNFVEAFVYDKDGNDVTHKYTLKYVYGTLTVKGRPLTVTAGSDIKAYDGEPLTCERYNVSSTLPMLEGHKVTAVTEGSITEVGQTDNLVASVQVTDKDGNDVTRCYDLKVEPGMLVVYSADSLVIESGSMARPYTGFPVTNASWSIVSGELDEGHSLVVTVTGSQTNVGVSPNYFSVQIFDKKGNDVTKNYEIICWPGELMVMPQSLTISSGSAEKVYDGAPLTCPEYTVGPEGIENLFDIVVEFTGSRTELGYSDNSFEVTVFDQNGTDVTENFDIDKDYGYLKVTDEDGDPGDDDDREDPDKDYSDITGGEGGTGGSGGSGGEGGEGGEDGEGGEGESPIVNGLETSGNLLGPGGGEGETVVYFTITATKKDRIYLRMKSFGDFDGTNTWAEPVEYGNLTDDGYSAFYITSLALDNSGLTTETLSITPDGGVFALPYYTLDGSFSVQTSDVIQMHNQKQTYYVNYFNWDSTAGLALPARYRSYEEEYREYVYDNYLYVDDESYEYMLGIIDEQNFSAEASDIISKVAKYIQNAAEYKLDYNPELDLEDNVVIAFLDEYKEGLCRHYASSAVLLFRSLGIPARYTIGFAGAVEANEESVITSDNYHAWVEVYVDGIGWVNVEVTGSSSDGSGEDSSPVKLTVAPVYTGDLYDAKVYGADTPLMPTQKISGFDSLTKLGYTYNVQISGSNSMLGIVQTEITELEIYNPIGELVYQKSSGLGSEKYVVTYKPGQLQLYYSVLKFLSDSISKEYDGISYVVDGENTHLLEGGLDDGYSYVIHSGTVANQSVKTYASYKVTVYDEYGVDRTDFYKLDCKYGSIAISTAQITVTAGSTSKVYDGTALVYNHIEYDPDMLAEGDYIDSYTVSGEQTNVGKSSNIIEKIVIKNKDGVDVTSSYVIKTVEGVLSVTLP